MSGIAIDEVQARICIDVERAGGVHVVALYPNSCSRVFELNSRKSGLIRTTIDVDGAGALKPFDVNCSSTGKCDG